MRIRIFDTVCYGSRRGGRKKVVIPDGVYKLVCEYSAQLDFEIGAHAPSATVTTNAFDHNAYIDKVQEWLGNVNIATTRSYDRRKHGTRKPNVQTTY